MAPGHFNATTSDRIDKMFQEVSSCSLTATSASTKRAARCQWSVKIILPIEYVMPRRGVALQVRDFAHSLKECEKQVKQLEVASVGKHICSVKPTVIGWTDRTSQ